MILAVVYHRIAGAVEPLAGPYTASLFVFDWHQWRTRH